MNIPTRLRILQHLAALIMSEPLEIEGQLVTMDDTNVIRGRITEGQETVAYDNLPVLNILESPRPDFPLYAGVDLEARAELWTILLQGICKDDAMATTDKAYYFHAAVEERLARIIQTKSSGSKAYPEYHMLGGLITGFELGPPVIRQPDNKGETGLAFFFLPVRVGVAGAIGKPYTAVP